jgi:hypothetical protein
MKLNWSHYLCQSVHGVDNRSINGFSPSTMSMHLRYSHAFIISKCLTAIIVAMIQLCNIKMQTMVNLTSLIDIYTKALGAAKVQCTTFTIWAL